jgi:hypothetical protein
MGSRLDEVTRMQQGRAHYAMPDHERHYRPLLFSKCQELTRNLAYRVTITRNIVRKPKAIKDREQQ